MTDTIQPTLLTIAETCGPERLRIARSFFYELVEAGEIKTVKIGRRRFVELDEVNRFIERHRRTGVT